MKALAVTLLLSSCAHTTIYDHRGRKVAMIQGDIQNLRLGSYPDGRVTVTADSMNHSNPTLAQGKAGSLRAEGIGSALSAVGLGFLVGQ